MSNRKFLNFLEYALKSSPTAHPNFEQSSMGCERASRKYSGL